MLGGFRKDTAARGPQEMIRVPSDLLEKLVNLAGETSITRSRVEMGVHGFAQTVEEMGATIQRLADQLRRMDSEMETQIVARHNDEAGKYEDAEESYDLNSCIECGLCSFVCISKIPILQYILLAKHELARMRSTEAVHD